MRRETHQVDLIHYIYLPLFAKETPGVRLLASLHCRTRENNWKNTLYFILTPTHKQCANLLSDVNRNATATFITDKFILSASPPPSLCCECFNISHSANKIRMLCP